MKPQACISEVNNKKFGIQRCQFDLISDAVSLQSIYDFTDNESEIAYFLSENYGIGINQAFHIVWHCKSREELK